MKSLNSTKKIESSLVNYDRIWIVFTVSFLCDFLIWYEFLFLIKNATPLYACLVEIFNWFLMLCDIRGFNDVIFLILRIAFFISLLNNLCNDSIDNLMNQFENISYSIHNLFYISQKNSMQTMFQKYRVILVFIVTCHPLKTHSHELIVDYLRIYGHSSVFYELNTTRNDQVIDIQSVYSIFERLNNFRTDWITNIDGKRKTCRKKTPFLCKYKKNQSRGESEVRNVWQM